MTDAKRQSWPECIRLTYNSAHELSVQALVADRFEMQLGEVVVSTSTSNQPALASRPVSIREEQIRRYSRTVLRFDTNAYLIEY